MKSDSVRRRVMFGAFALAFCTVVCGAGDAGQGDRKGAAYPKGHYAALDKLPDWGGIWTITFGGPGSKREAPSLKGKYLTDYQTWKKDADAHNGAGKKKGDNCTPPGMPYIMGVGQYPIEFMFTPGRVTIHHEAWMQWRNIFTDGRAHADTEPSFYGDSTGKWEGNTLLVDTVNVKDTVPLSGGMYHSDKIRITERFHLDAKDADQLVIEVTVADPEALEKPYTNVYTFTRSREYNLLEFICAENDRNKLDDEGNTTFHE
ncbi:MAG: hypothetical protein WDO56_27510 [Gammaproteobacteria bacterium]